MEPLPDNAFTLLQANTSNSVSTTASGRSTLDDDVDDLRDSSSPIAPRRGSFFEDIFTSGSLLSARSSGTVGVASNTDPVLRLLNQSQAAANMVCCGVLGEKKYTRDPSERPAKRTLAAAGAKDVTTQQQLGLPFGGEHGEERFDGVVAEGARSSSMPTTSTGVEDNGRGRGPAVVVPPPRYTGQTSYVEDLTDMRADDEFRDHDGMSFASALSDYGGISANTSGFASPAGRASPAGGSGRPSALVVPCRSSGADSGAAPLSLDLRGFRSESQATSSQDRLPLGGPTPKTLASSQDRYSRAPDDFRYSPPAGPVTSEDLLRPLLYRLEHDDPAISISGRAPASSSWWRFNSKQQTPSVSNSTPTGTTASGSGFSAEFDASISDTSRRESTSSLDGAGVPAPVLQPLPPLYNRPPPELSEFSILTDHSPMTKSDLESVANFPLHDGSGALTPGEGMCALLRFCVQFHHGFTNYLVNKSTADVDSGALLHPEVAAVVKNVNISIMKRGFALSGGGANPGGDTSIPGSSTPQGYSGGTPGRETPGEGTAPFGGSRASREGSRASSRTNSKGRSATSASPMVVGADGPPRTTERRHSGTGSYAVTK